MAPAIISQWGYSIAERPSITPRCPLQPGPTLPALVFRSRVLSTSKVSRSPFLWIDARGLQCGDVQKYVRAAGVVSDETVTAFGIPHFQFSGRHRVLFPLRLQPQLYKPALIQVALSAGYGMLGSLLLSDDLPASPSPLP